MLENWTTSFPNCEPIAHQLREVFNHRWIRFHSLPNGKRYPESEAEYQTLLHRFNAIVNEVAQPGEGVVLLVTEFSDAPVPAKAPPDWPGSAWWRTAEVDGGFWHVYGARVASDVQRFGRLLRRVADCVTGNVMICHSECDWVVHPYDGGVDAILRLSASRDRLRERFKDWLSPRDDGL